MTSPFSQSVLDVVACIDSVAQLELLLLLRRHGTTPVPPAEAARELRMSPAGAESQLAALCHRGLIAARGREYVYAAEGATDAAIAVLAEAFQTHPVMITTLIYAQPRRAVRDFADAFKVRRPEGPPCGPPSPPDPDPAGGNQRGSSQGEGENHGG